MDGKIKKEDYLKDKYGDKWKHIDIEARNVFGKSAICMVIESKKLIKMGTIIFAYCAQMKGDGSILCSVIIKERKIRIVVEISNKFVH